MKEKNKNIILEKYLDTTAERRIYSKLRKKMFLEEIVPLKEKVNFLCADINKLSKVINKEINEKNLDKKILKKIQETIRGDEGVKEEELDKRRLKKIQETIRKPKK